MIVDQRKNYEFRSRLYPLTVVRIWFYETAPTSALTFICEVDPGLARDPSNPLPLDGHRNKEFNEGIEPDWSRTLYAYKVRSCYKIRNPISLQELKKTYQYSGAPRGMVYITNQMMEDIIWHDQELMWSDKSETG